MEIKKILYCSCHEILEADELTLFTELGYDTFSMGAYSNPLHAGITRPAIKGARAHPHLHAVYLQCSKENVHEQLVDFADVVVMMHNSRVNVVDHPQPWLGATPTTSGGMTGNNWEKLKKKPVIWRSIGQSNETTEVALRPFRDDGLKIVRYSPKEETIPGYVGSDAMIRFYKDPEEFKDWNGNKLQVITIAQSMNHPSRVRELNFKAFVEATEPFERRLFGIGNETSGLIGGQLTFEELKQELRDARIYLFTGTQPASYVLNFIEAWMTGIPIVALGKSFMKSFPDQDTYEVPELIENGVTGYVGESIEELRKYIGMLLNDAELAKRIGVAGREKAIEVFGKQAISKQWEEFLEGVVGK